MKTAEILGTILPTRQTFVEAEKFHQARLAMQARVAANSPELRGCEVRIVGGEIRYYDTTDQYAIIARDGKVLWFAVREDGDYRIGR